MVRIDRQARLVLQILLAQVHIVVRPVDDLHVDALVRGRPLVAGNDVDRDHGKGILQRIVPDTERRRVLCRRQLKLDRAHRRGERRPASPRNTHGESNGRCAD